ncbi:hypothetical protein H4S06_000037 [Coemansia sp. BCRC 34490]|nr:hypothetical protein H4S06_000037 [Coemansia sp. BCRC 34490]
MPVYTDEYCNVNYQSLKDADFNTVSMLPDIFASACKVPAPCKDGDIKLATVRILRFKGFSGVLVFVSLAHGIVDGHGFCSFMEQWAGTAKMLQNTGYSSQAHIPIRKFTHDRSVNYSYRCSGTDKIDPRICDALSTSNIVSRCLAWISHGARGRLVNSVVSLDPPMCCYFRISKQTVESLRNIVQDHSFDCNTRYSHNDIITALITTVIVQAMRKHDVEQEKGGSFLPSLLFKSKQAEENRQVLTSFAVDIRPRVDNPNIANFMGNAIVVKHTTTPLNLIQTELTPKALADVAYRIRQAVRGISRQWIGQHCNLLNSAVDGYVRALLYDVSHRYKVFITNHARFGHYKVDFGAGIPSLVRPATIAFPNIVFVMPCHPSNEGYELAMPLTRAVGKAIVQNRNWMQMLEKYSFNF